MTRRVTPAARFSRHTYVLIAAVSDYRGKGLDDLPVCALQATELETVLTDASGCAIPPGNVIRIPENQITAERLREALAILLLDRTVDDTLIIYLAGHGAIRHDEFHFLTGAADTEEGLSASTLDALLNPVSLRGVLLVADCCGGADLIQHAPSFFRTPNRSEFRLFLSASRAGQSSWELSDQRRSLFTSRFIQALREDVGIADSGGIYYAALYEFLHTSVQEDAQKFLGDRAAQEPVATGTQSGNPLLFLKRDLSLGTVRIRLQKITYEYLQHRLRIAVGAVAVAAVLVLGGYWTWLDSHQYLRLDGNVTLVHGYPGLSGFKLPEEDWRFPFAADALTGESPLGERQIVFSRSGDAAKILSSALRPGPRAILQLWQGRSEEALDTLLASPDWGSHGALALQMLSVKGREGRLIELFPQLDWEAQLATVKALAKYDVDGALKLFRESPLGSNAGLELDLLAAWSAPCNLSVQQWLEDFLAREVRAPFQTIATTAVIAGCRYPTELLWDDPEHPEHALMALRLTDPEVAESLAREWQVHLEAFARNAPSPDPTTRSERFEGMYFVLDALRFLPPGPCLPQLLEETRYDTKDEQSYRARMLGAIHVVRNCPGYRAVAQVSSLDLVIRVRTPAGQTYEVQRAKLHLFAQPDILETLDMMIDLEVENTPLAIIALLGSGSVDSLVRVALLERLAFLRAMDVDPTSYLTADEPRLERPVAEWLTQRDPREASAFLRKRLQVPDSNRIGTLALIPLTPDDRTIVLRYAQRFDAIHRSMTVALIGSAEEVAAALTDTSPQIRMQTAQYVALRPDSNEILERARKRSRYPDGALLSVEGLRTELEELTEILERTPPWGRAWLISRLEHHRAQSSAAALHLMRLRRRYQLAP